MKKGHRNTNNAVETCITKGIHRDTIRSVKRKMPDPVALYDMAETTAGKKWVKMIFPIMSTIFLIVIVSNLIKLIPGMETIGWLGHAHEEGEGYQKAAIIPGVLYSITDQEVGEHEEGYEVIPWFRSPSTDLNFTVGLALIAMTMVQVIGVNANGVKYFTKFFNFGPFVSIWTKKNLGPFDVIMPFIDIFVGILELISEFAKILSFSFRLFGSMFGGAILVVVIGTILPAITFSMYFLELFFGAVQAFVFGMLTLVFMTVATQPPHGEHEEEH